MCVPKFTSCSIHHHCWHAFCVTNAGSERRITVPLGFLQLKLYPWQAVDVGVRGDERLLMRVRAAIAIGRMQQARDTAAMLNKTAGWQALAAAAVHSMDIQLAIE